MNQAFQRLSLNGKISAIVMLTSCFSLLLACIILGAVDIHNMRARILAQTDMLAEVTSANSAAALAFGDPAAATRTLNALAAQPDIELASLYDANGALFGSYPAGSKRGIATPTPTLSLSETSGAVWSRSHLELIRPVMLDGDVIGALAIRSNLSELSQRRDWFIATGAFVLFVSSLAAYGLSRLLRRVVSRPILGLVETMKVVTTERNYSLRGEEESRADELGALVTGFNEMLAEVQQRDEALREHKEHLEGLVETRTSELSAANRGLTTANHDLQRAKDEAERANEAKSEFLARMSHEIRTPMNGVLGMIELLLGTELADKQRRFARTVQSSAQALLAIINDVLDFSKIEAGRLEIECVDFDPRELTSDVLALFEETAERKNVALRYHAESTATGLVSGDPTRVRQVLLNLVGNAFKFTDAGAVTVDLDRQQSGDEIRLKFRVRDTGVGIEPQHLERIFDAFDQADGSTARRYGGTGLGLAISRQLVEMMGGCLEVESEPGHGATFGFTVTVAPPIGNSVDDALEDERRDETQPGRPVEARGFVLLCEDNPVNQEVALEMIGLLGWTVEVAGTGDEAIAALGRTRYDVVLMDCEMPGMDGYEATRRIREAEAGKAAATGKPGRLPIVALTAHALARDRKRCFDVGMDDCLTKPFTLRQLEATLLRWLPSASSGRLAPSSTR